jgi:predicted nucleic acid-binding protein
LKELSIIFRIVPLTYNELFKASELHWNDFEDAVQFVTAQTNDASFIITRNKKDYTDTGKLKAITPEEFFWLLKSFDIRRYLHDEASAEP